MSLDPSRPRLFVTEAEAQQITRYLEETSADLERRLERRKKMSLKILLFQVICCSLIMGGVLVSHGWRYGWHQVPSMLVSFFWGCVISFYFFIAADAHRSKRQEKELWEEWGKPLVQQAVIFSQACQAMLERRKY